MVYTEFICYTFWLHSQHSREPKPRRVHVYQQTIITLYLEKVALRTINHVYVELNCGSRSNVQQQARKTERVSFTNEDYHANLNFDNTTGIWFEFGSAGEAISMEKNIMAVYFGI